MRRRLKVEPIPGEIMRFHVESQRAGVPPYLVDLEALDLNGCCACENFEHRIFPLVKAQLTVPWDKRVPVLCIHLIDATEYFDRQLKKALSESLNKKAAEPIIIGGDKPTVEPRRESARLGFFQKFLQWRETPEDK